MPMLLPETPDLSIAAPVRPCTQQHCNLQGNQADFRSGDVGKQQTGKAQQAGQKAAEAGISDRFQDDCMACAAALSSGGQNGERSFYTLLGDSKHDSNISCKSNLA